MTEDYDPTEIERLLSLAQNPDLANHDRGQALEDLATALFGPVPGIKHLRRNTLDAHGCQEIDLAFWNDGDAQGLRGFDQIIHVESTNWCEPVGSLEVAWFDTKLRLRGRQLGILFSLSGVTGNLHSLRSAEDVISNALREGREILVVSIDDLHELEQPGDLVRLLQTKRVQLSVTRGLTT